MRSCTRRLEFDAAHRVMRHESRCRNLHGHRYRVDVTCEAGELDALGRVIDFGIIKTVFGGWIDEKLDHGAIVHGDDAPLISLCGAEGWKVYALRGGHNPTAEWIACELFERACELLAPHGVIVRSLRVYETPNCWADYP
jgi:6-pyruvoyltetrahydropterin/6-carboxytetrahydropterin synthase